MVARTRGNVQVISKRLPPVLCIFPLEINIKQKTSDEGKIICFAARGEAQSFS